jgi:outer membrane receptor protein involved in Fe transport
LATALSLAPNAEARGLLGGARIVLKEGRLADALRDLSVRSGSDLLFAPDVVGGLRNKRIAGPLQVEPILSRLLEGTGLSYRRVGDGAFIVYRPELDQPTALPEVLIVGRKAQNADIRRTQNDIQGYRVAAAADIRSSHVDNLDQFLRSRQSNNAEHFGPLSDPRGEYATNRSEVDFHGLGPSQTLVLVDGARMPSMLSLNYVAQFYQPDVNGLPLLAIDRIESLTGTAGGIYGPGATGGVINVILKRDYRGAEISTTAGATTQGDAARRRIDARIGFTPDHGATDVMINVSRAESQGLRFGERDFDERSLKLQIARKGTVPNFLNGVMITSTGGDTLRLGPALGGASLGSTFTYLPLGTTGVGDGSILLANAGQYPGQPAPDGNGDLRSLTSSTIVTSLLFNARHRFGDNVEAVIDFVGWENQGRSVSGFDVQGYVLGWPLTQPQGGSEGMKDFPFSQPVEVSFPFPGLDAVSHNRIRTTRASAKVIFDLSRSWRGEASYSAGAMRNRITKEGFTFDRNFLMAFFLMQPGDNGEPTPSPLGSWDDFVKTLQIYKIPDTQTLERKLRLRDMAVRLGGPILRRQAGDVALSLLAEQREERAKLTPWLENGESTLSDDADPSFAVKTTSLYGELRAPILSRQSGLSALRGLELQLATRYDRVEADIPAGETGNPRDRYRRAGMVYTAGFRAFPLEHLLVRASVATGVLPPTPDQMIAGHYTLSEGGSWGYTDPARGGELVGLKAPIPVLTNGSPNLRPEKARTVALGVILNPDERRGPRVSVDYTHTEKRNEISEVDIGSLSYFLNNEARYPDRIVRAPLTADDIAAGLTAGVIIKIDATYLNVGRTTVDAVDLHVDQGFALGEDRVRLFGGLTWTPRLTRQIAADKPVQKYTGTNDGPLRWKGAGGAAWEHGPLTVQLEAQYFGAYLSTGALSSAAKATIDLAPYRVPAQAYLDAAVTWRLQRSHRESQDRDVELRFGVQNLLDHQPPTVASNDYGYSYYGDPRGRRFEVSATARF